MTLYPLEYRSMNRVLKLLASLFSTAIALHAFVPHTVTVDPSGAGDFKTLSEAVESLPMFTYERMVIFIKNGTYEEKIRIDQDYITLRGESRDGVKIVGDLPRQRWLDNPDPIGPAVVNLFGDDIIIENLTIENTQPRTDIHAFAIYGQGTRTIIQNANVWSNGGDTVSLWNYKEGMYYHADCDFRGAVDFVCPRGWCYIENSNFHCVRTTAAIWHAGGYDKDQKFVLRNCSFDGTTDFELGRNHYDAQFFLLDCQFSDEVMDKPIYRMLDSNPAKNRPDNWGHRVYFYNSFNPRLDWTQDNLSDFDPDLDVEAITAEWTFAGRWNPESKATPRIVKIETREDGKIDLFFNERISVRGTPVLSNGSNELTYHQGGGSNQLTFTGKLDSIPTPETINALRLSRGSLLGTIATRGERIFTARNP